MLFKKTTSRSPWWPLSHLVGLGLLAALAIVAWLLDLPPLAIGAASAGVMLVVAIWEWGSFHGGWVHDVMPVGDAEVPSGEDKS
jgi:hypothetical protein